MLVTPVAPIRASAALIECNKIGKVAHDQRQLKLSDVRSMFSMSENRFGFSVRRQRRMATAMEVPPGGDGGGAGECGGCWGNDSPHVEDREDDMGERARKKSESNRSNTYTVLMG